MRISKPLGGLLSLCLFVAAAQNGVSTYPAAIDTDQTLTVAVNNFSGKLATSVNPSDTAWALTNMSGAPVVGMLLTADREVVQVASVSGNLVIVIRARDNSAAVAHAQNANVQGLITAWHHNVMRDAVKKVEGALGPNLANVQTMIDTAVAGVEFPPATPPSLPFVSVQGYDFAAQAPGGSLIPGNNTITFAPVPAGVNATNTGHYLYVSGGTGTPESCLITGGTAVSGAASGTIIAQCANSHSGEWTIGSATAGIEEALWSTPQSSSVALAPGQYRLYGPIVMGSNAVSSSISTAPTLRGAGRQSTYLVVDSTFPLTAAGVIQLAYSSAVGSAQVVSDLAILFTQPDSTSLASYTHWPPAIKSAGASKPTLRDLAIILAWDGIDFTGFGSNGAVIDNVLMSAYHRGISFDQVWDSVYLSRFHFWPVGATANQLAAMVSDSITAVYSGHMDDLHWTDSLVYGARCADFYTGADTFPTLAEITQLACDGSTGLRIASGQISIANSKFAPNALSGAVGIQVSGGNVIVTGSHFGQPAVGAAPLLYFTPGAAGAVLQAIGNYFKTYNIDLTSIGASSAAAGDSTLVVSGNYFQRTKDVAYSAPTIDVNATSGNIRASIVGNSVSTKGTGAGIFANLHQDDLHMVRSNRLQGWTVTVPVPADLGVYEGWSIEYLPVGYLRQLGRAAFAGLGTPLTIPGFQVYCTDCTTAATCAGSGSGHVATSNGTNWTCN